MYLTNTLTKSSAAFNTLFSLSPQTVPLLHFYNLKSTQILYGFTIFLDSLTLCHARFPLFPHYIYRMKPKNMQR